MSGPVTSSVFVTLPRAAFHGDSLNVLLVLSDPLGAVQELPYRLLGPGRAGS